MNTIFHVYIYMKLKVKRPQIHRICKGRTNLRCKSSVLPRNYSLFRGLS